MKPIKQITKITLAVIWVLLNTLCFSCERSMVGSTFLEEPPTTISSYVEENQEEYSHFWDLLVHTEMNLALTAYNPNGEGYTLFMPNNQAFDRYIENSEDYDTFEDLLEDLKFSTLLIRYHLVNRSIETNDFPYGALPDTTYSGDLLTIGFNQTLDSTVYKVNNLAPIVGANIELINGYIHVIDEVLEPVEFSSYDWLFENEDYSILAEAFTITALADTMGVLRQDQSGAFIKNLYTVLAEPDSIFHKAGIFSIEELIERYNSPGLEYTDEVNDLYQFVAYHLLEGSYFLDEFSGLRNYNTYANAPVQINADYEIHINTGVDTLETIIDGSDTTFITYVSMDMVESNILTKNGAIHVLHNVMEVFVPSRTEITLQFYEEPRINELSNEIGEHELTNTDSYEVLSWSGPESIWYYSSGSDIPANSNDYLYVSGNFTISYTVPKMLPGKYTVQLKTESDNSNNATIQVYVDGKRMGGSFDLTSGGNPYNVFTVGSVEFFDYDQHQVSLESLLPGELIWDFVRFIPE